MSENKKNTDDFIGKLSESDWERLDANGIDQDTLEDWLNYSYSINGREVFPMREGIVEIGRIVTTFEKTGKNIQEITVLDIGCGTADSSDFPLGQDEEKSRIFEPWMLRAATLLGIGTEKTRIGIDIAPRPNSEPDHYKHIPKDIIEIIDGKGLRQLLKKEARGIPQFDIVICNNLFIANRFAHLTGSAPLSMSSPSLLNSIKAKPEFIKNAKKLGIDLNVETQDQDSLEKEVALLWYFHDLYALKLLSQIKGLQFLSNRKSPVLDPKTGHLLANGFIDSLSTDLPQLAFLQKSMDRSGPAHQIALALAKIRDIEL